MSDDGLGIEPEHHGKIFELFTQVQKPGQGKGGLGIGLTVVKQLVELHRGSISVHSDGRGKGSEFKVCLPAAARPQLPDETEVGGALTKATATRVLVVDDNADTADMLAVCLRMHGYEAKVAYTGSDALALFPTFRPRVVLLDLGLPDMHGSQVAEGIRATGAASQVQLIAVTGWGQAKDREASQAAGFDLHFVKPVDPLKLMAQLQA